MATPDLYAPGSKEAEEMREERRCADRERYDTVSYASDVYNRKGCTWNEWDSDAVTKYVTTSCTTHREG